MSRPTRNSGGLRSSINNSTGRCDILPVARVHPLLGGTRTATKQTVDDCAGPIREALGRWQEKYYQALSPNGSGNALKDTGRKIQWFLREQERVAELQAKLSQGTQRLKLLSALAVRQVCESPVLATEGRYVCLIPGGL
jgi:hypothetical protein